MKYALILLVVIVDCFAFPPNEVKQDDAKSSARVIGGFPARIQNFPWQAALLYREDLLCSATIITDKRAITTATCIYPTALHVYTLVAGTGSLKGPHNRTTQNGFRTSISKAIRHPGYNERTRSHNIAVIWLSKKLPLSIKIQPIRIPVQGMDVPYGSTGLVSGWGTTAEASNKTSNELIFTSAPIMTNEKCNQFYPDRLYSNMVCAGHLEGGRGVCEGDQGAALVLNGAAIGLVSFGHGCARPNLPAIYTRVPAYTNWIRSVI